MKIKTKILSFFILSSFLLVPIAQIHASLSDDFDAYQKFPLYEKYEKKQKYDLYKELQRVKKKLGFDDPAKKQAAKDAYNNYKLYKKDKIKYKNFATLLPQYNAYKKYLKYTDYGKYKKYKKYDVDKYDKYKNYDRKEDGYNRYKDFMNDLGNVTTNPGPEIRVGLWSKNSIDSQEGHDPFRISANKAFTVSNCVDAPVGTIPANVDLRIANAGDGQLTVYSGPDNSIITKQNLYKKVCMQAADGNNWDMIFDVNTPKNISKAGYDHYRGKIKIQHSTTEDNQKLYEDVDNFVDNDAAPGHAKTRLWVINTLPLEQYLWGYGEMSTGGIDQLAKTMIIAARSYARWYIDITPTLKKWGDYPNPDHIGEVDGEGFDLTAYSVSQIYNGYDYETDPIHDHSFIADAARKTNGIVMKYDNDYIVAAYCSNTDGNTRYGGYPYLMPVPDPYGKIDSPGKGNHMQGLSANGAKVLARDYNWDFSRILSYYYTGIDIVKDY